MAAWTELSTAGGALLPRRGPRMDRAACEVDVRTTIQVLVSVPIQALPEWFPSQEQEPVQPEVGHVLLPRYPPPYFDFYHLSEHTAVGVPVQRFYSTRAFPLCDQRDTFGHQGLLVGATRRVGCGASRVGGVGPVSSRPQEPPAHSSCQILLGVSMIALVSASMIAIRQR